MAVVVKTGLDRVAEGKCSLKGLRLGMVTNHSAISADCRDAVEVLSAQGELKMLFAPEHGLWGVLGPGDRVSGGIDPISGLPVVSLFEDLIYCQDNAKKEAAYLPAQHLMEQIDGVVFDIQDVGSRYYTYASTLFYLMQACTTYGKRCIVLDRPNPIGGLKLEGNCHSPHLLSFIGLTQTPIRHSWTIGELARFYQGEYHHGCLLEVVELEGWHREMFFDETGLPFVKPSPNLPTLDSVILYNGSCMLAGTNVSDGRGTTSPFVNVGAPFIDSRRFSRELNGVGLPGVCFSPAYFIPAFGKHAGTACGGVTIHITSPKAVEPVALGVWLIRILQKLYPQQFCFTPPTQGDYFHIDLATGNSDLRTNTLSAPQLLDSWRVEAERFGGKHKRYCIY